LENNYQILLGSAQSKESVVEDNFLNIELKGDNSLIEETDIQTMLDLNEQYIKERENCTKYRLTITINPICTNVLCNPTSTIIQRGTTNDILITNRVVEDGFGLPKSEMTKFIYNPVGAIGNNNVDYYMGYDIFDNVYFRTNSIRRGRYMDDTVETVMGQNVTRVEYAYMRDNINGYDQAIRENMVESDGWIQCINPSRIMIWEVKSGETTHSLKNTSKIAFVKGGNCEKTDLFPNREMLLFNTLFKYNSANRLINEENWSYFLSYPCENIYDHWLTHTPNTSTIPSVNNSSHGIPIINIEIIDAEKSPFNKPTLILETAYSNKFKVFNKIRLYYGNQQEADYTIQRIKDDRKFYILSNASNLLPFEKSTSVISFECRVKKVVNGIPCDYYIKKFRKIPNWKFESEKITSGNIEEKLQTNKILFNNTKYNLAYSNNIFSDKMVQITFTDSVDINLLKDNLGRPLTKIYLTIYKNNEHEVDWGSYLTRRCNDANRPKNEVFQARLIDESYKTDFQRYWSQNSVGYELAYSNKNIIRDDIRLGLNYRNRYPNIYCFHNLSHTSNPNHEHKITISYNVNYRNSLSADERLPFIWPYSPNSIESVKPIDVKTNIEDPDKLYYYGDICEFDKSNFTETVLSKSQYRFNTVNRESDLFHDTAIITHGIALFNSDGISSLDTVNAPAVSNQYKPDTGENTFQPSPNTTAFFGNTTLPDDCTSVKDSNNRMIYRGVIQAGPRPEGYYHQSHYPISLKWYESELHYKSFYRVYFTTTFNPPVNITEYILSNPNRVATERCVDTESGKNLEFIPFFTRTKHNLLQHTILKVIWLHDSIEREKAFVITTTREDERKILIPFDQELYDYINISPVTNINSLEVYVYDYDTPLWARHIGQGRFVWRNIMSGDDAAVNSLEEYPFTNGNIYVHKQINFFLRRQSIGCPDMLFNRFPADTSISREANMTELYEDINEIC